MKVSVITPSYNQGKFIEKTIQSVIHQNYEPLEFIIIDGGSTDETLDIIKKYESYISEWISEKDGGQGDAINKGLKIASGDIIAWLNSDDQYTEGTLDKVTSLFAKNPSVQLIHGETTMQYINGKQTATVAHNEDIEKRYLAGMPYPQPSSFFTAKVIREQGGIDDALHFGLDYDLSVRIALNYDILQISDLLSIYLIHENSKTSKDSLKFAEDWAIVYSRVLRSFDFTKDLIGYMRKLELYHEDAQYYKVTKEFDKRHLISSFLYFLYYQVYFLYEGYDLKKVEHILKFLKSFSPKFFKENALDKMYFRCRFPLGKQLIQTARYITR